MSLGGRGRAHKGASAHNEDRYIQLHKFFVRDRNTTLASKIDPRFLSLNYHYYMIDSNGNDVPVAVQSRDFVTLAPAAETVIRPSGRGTLETNPEFTAFMFFEDKQEMMKAKSNSTPPLKMNLQEILTMAADSNFGILLVGSQSRNGQQRRLTLLDPGRVREYSHASLEIDSGDIESSIIDSSAVNHNNRQQIYDIIGENYPWIVAVDFGYVTQKGQQNTCVFVEPDQGLPREFIDLKLEGFWRDAKAIIGPCIVGEADLGAVSPRRSLERSIDSARDN